MTLFRLFLARVHFWFLVDWDKSFFCLGACILWGRGLDLGGLEASIVLPIYLLSLKVGTLLSGMDFWGQGWLLFGFSR